MHAEQNRPLSNGWFAPLVHFVKFTQVNILTFFLDLILLFVLTNLCNVYYIFSAIISFIIAAVVNYSIVRTFVFCGTKRSVSAGLMIFICSESAGLIGIVVLMYLLVTIFNVNYIVSRIIVACSVGFLLYLVNTRVNFIMPENDQTPSSHDL